MEKLANTAIFWTTFGTSIMGVLIVVLIYFFPSIPDFRKKSWNQWRIEWIFKRKVLKQLYRNAKQERKLYAEDNRTLKQRKKDAKLCVRGIKFVKREFNYETETNEFLIVKIQLVKNWPTEFWGIIALKINREIKDERYSLVGKYAPLPVKEEGDIYFGFPEFIAEDKTNDKILDVFDKGVRFKGIHMLGNIFKDEIDFQDCRDASQVIVRGDNYTPESERVLTPHKSFCKNCGNLVLESEQGRFIGRDAHIGCLASIFVSKEELENCQKELEIVKKLLKEKGIDYDFLMDNRYLLDSDTIDWLNGGNSK